MISLSKPEFKKNKYISVANNIIKININDIKIKNIQKIIKSDNYYISIYIPEEIADTISKIDNEILEYIIKNNDNWFSNDLLPDELKEMFRESYCKQTKTLKILLSRSYHTKILMDNKETEFDNILDILLNIRKYKKYIINIEIQHIGLYIYPELSCNKWIIKSINIINIDNEVLNWDKKEIENSWNDNIISVYEDIDNKINNLMMEIDKLKNYKKEINKIFDEACKINICNKKWEDKLTELKLIILKL